MVSSAAGGDLTREVPVKGDDALGRIGEGFTKFLGDLRLSVGAIAENSVKPERNGRGAVDASAGR